VKQEDGRSALHHDIDDIRNTCLALDPCTPSK
jgi:hypothetical protein